MSNEIEEAKLQNLLLAIANAKEVGYMHSTANIVIDGHLVAIPEAWAESVKKAKLMKIKDKLFICNECGSEIKYQCEEKCFVTWTPMVDSRGSWCYNESPRHGTYPEMEYIYSSDNVPENGFFLCPNPECKADFSDEAIIQFNIDREKANE